eukprot:4624083-Alexandrium_andersonii.AAC.1
MVSRENLVSWSAMMSAPMWAHWRCISWSSVDLGLWPLALVSNMRAVTLMVMNLARIGLPGSLGRGGGRAAE